MALTLAQQYDAAISGLTTGDIDLVARMLTAPDSITPDELRTTAEKWGIKKGFLSAAVNTFTDPVVLISMLMSRKFPARAFAQGTIEQRFWGHAKEAGGIAKVARPINSIFRSTLNPKMDALIRARQAEFHKLARRYEEIQSVPTWKDDRLFVTQILDGANPAGAGARHYEQAKQIRPILNEVWGLTRRAKFIKGGLDDKQIPYALSKDEAFRRGLADMPPPKYLRDYLPHIPLHIDAKDAMFEIDPLVGIRNLKTKLATQATSIAKVPFPWQVKNGQVFSDPARFHAWMGSAGIQVYNPRLFPRSRGVPVTTRAGGQQLFHLDLDYLMDQVFSSGARTYSLNVPLSPIEQRLVSARVRGADGVIRTQFATDEPPIVQIVKNGINASAQGGKARVTNYKIPGTAYTDRKGVKHPEIVGQQFHLDGISAPALNSLNWHVRGLQGRHGDDSLFVGTIYNTVYDALHKAIPQQGLQRVNEVAASVAAQQRKQSFREHTNFLTGYLYRSILGANPWIAIQNSFQVPLTVQPAIGMGSTVAGIVETASRVKTFMRSVATQQRQVPKSVRGFQRLNETVRRAVRESFPELEDMGMDPVRFALDFDAVNATGALRANKFRGIDEFLKTIMAPFLTTEFANRSTSYFGFRHAVRKAIKTGEYPHPMVPVMKKGKLVGERLATAQELSRVIDFEAKHFVNETQFVPGPGSRTVFQYNLNPLERMFQAFPLRLFNYFADSMTKGALSNAEMQTYRNLKGFYGQLQKEGIMAVPGAISANIFGGRNLGTLARVIIGSKLLDNTLGDVAGIDISGSLGLTLPLGAFNDFGQPFAPLPLPPVAGILVNSYSAFTTRDVKKLQPLELPGGRTLPIPKTLFPGGISISKFSRALNQFRPDQGGFYDDNDRLMYKGNTTDLVLRMLGVPLEKAKHERQIMERLHANRGRIRQIRRRFLAAASNGDTAKMDALRGQWGEEFKDMPPLDASRGDLNVYRSGQQRTRVERMMRTLPKGFEFIRRDLYDVEPDLWSSPPMLSSFPGAGAFSGAGALPQLAGVGAR